jgi:hypothetical protein
MDSHIEGGSEFLSDQLLDDRAGIVANTPVNDPKRERLLFQALAYIVSDIEMRREKENHG